MLGLAKISDLEYKLIYIPEFKLFNSNYKGYFIDEKITNNNLLFKVIDKNDFNKWYKVDLDIYDNLLCIYYKEKRLNL